MEFQIKILLLSFITSIVLGLIVIPILKKLKVGQNEREDGPKSHLKKQGTPTMGGIIIAIVISLLGGFLYYKYSKTEPIIAQNFLPLIMVSLGCGLIGFIDDFNKLVLKNTKGINPTTKILGLLLVSVGFTMYLLYVQNINTDIIIPFFNNLIVLPFWIYVPFTIFVILSATNAINLTDGIDGLATSVVIVLGVCLTIISIIFNIKEVTLIGSILIGSCLGFLIFNLNPAKIFMGDTGSLLLGGAIAGMAISMKLPIIILIIAIIPIIEVLSVIIQVAYFKRTGRRVFKMAPYHHHLELSGWSENKIVIIFTFATILLSIIGIISII